MNPELANANAEALDAADAATRAEFEFASNPQTKAVVEAQERLIAAQRRVATVEEMIQAQTTTETRAAARASTSLLARMEARVAAGTLTASEFSVVGMLSRTSAGFGRLAASEAFAQLGTAAGVGFTAANIAMLGYFTFEGVKAGMDDTHHTIQTRRTLHYQQFKAQCLERMHEKNPVMYDYWMRGFATDANGYENYGSMDSLNALFDEYAKVRAHDYWDTSVRFADQVGGGSRFNFVDPVTGKTISGKWNVSYALPPESEQDRLINDLFARADVATMLDWPMQQQAEKECSAIYLNEMTKLQAQIRSGATLSSTYTPSGLAMAARYANPTTAYDTQMAALITRQWSTSGSFANYYQRFVSAYHQAYEAQQNAIQAQESYTTIVNNAKAAEAAGTTTTEGGESATTTANTQTTAESAVAAAREAGATVNADTTGTHPGEYTAFYADGSYSTIKADGTEIRYRRNPPSIVTTSPDGTVATTRNGTVSSVAPDGTITFTAQDGTVTITPPDAETSVPLTSAQQAQIAATQTAAQQAAAAAALAAQTQASQAASSAIAAAQPTPPSSYPAPTEVVEQAPPRGPPPVAELNLSEDVAKRATEARPAVKAAFPQSIAKGARRLGIHPGARAKPAVVQDLELQKFRVVGLVEIPDNIPVQEPKSDSIFDMPILGFVNIPDWLMSPFVSHPMPHNDADVIPPAAPAEPEPAAPSPAPAPAQPAPAPAEQLAPSEPAPAPALEPSPTAPDDLEYLEAALANEAYSPVDKRLPDVRGAAYKQDLSNDHIAVYKDGNVLFMASRGTANLADGIQDVGMLFNNFDLFNRQGELIDATKKAIAQFPNTDAIVFTGHSMGAAVQEAAALKLLTGGMKTPMHVRSFNPYRGEMERAGGAVHPEIDYQQYITQNDFIAGRQTDNAIVRRSSASGMLGMHSIANFMHPADVKRAEDRNVPVEEDVEHDEDGDEEEEETGRVTPDPEEQEQEDEQEQEEEQEPPRTPERRQQQGDAPDSVSSSDATPTGPPTPDGNPSKNNNTSKWAAEKILAYTKAGTLNDITHYYADINYLKGENVYKWVRKHLVQGGVHMRTNTPRREGAWYIDNNVGIPLSQQWLDRRAPRNADGIPTHGLTRQKEAIAAAGKEVFKERFGDPKSVDYEAKWRAAGFEEEPKSGLVCFDSGIAAGERNRLGIRQVGRLFSFDGTGDIHGLGNLHYQEKERNNGKNPGNGSKMILQLARDWCVIKHEAFHKDKHNLDSLTTYYHVETGQQVTYGSRLDKELYPPDGRGRAYINAALRAAAEPPVGLRIRRLRREATNPF